MKPKTTIPVKTPTGEYPIHIYDGVLTDAGAKLRELGFAGKCAIVTNPTVGQYYAEQLTESLTDAGFSPVLCEIPDGEQYKTLATVAGLYDRFLAAGLERGNPVLSLGGGVTGDIAGFAAASYLRGVPFVQIPTSLLAMVDASVGGKTGVDLPQGKNLVGAFKQPEMVLIDPLVLETLPGAEFRSGLAEVVKHGIIADETLLEKLRAGDFSLGWMIAAAVRVKVSVVEEDPFESGRRAVLNLGHTFGHAFEKLSDFRLRHGEGVAMGIVCAARLAQSLGHCTPETTARITDTLAFLDLPTEPPAHPFESVWAAMGADKKKAAGKLRFVLPRAIGDVDIFADVPRSVVQSILE